MYPFGDLPGNLTAFCRSLRTERGFLIGPGEVQDAARALALVPIGDELAVRDAWRPILASNRDEAAVFDRAFSEFFFPGPAGTRQLSQPPLDDEHAITKLGRRRRKGASADAPEIERDGAGQSTPSSDTPAEADTRDRPLTLARTSYSPHAGADDDDRVTLALDPRWRDAARMFVRRMQVGLSRRWRPAPRGRRFDARRTLRSSLQRGGEIHAPRWLARARRAPRFVLVVDGSRSMAAFAQKALSLGVALASVTVRIEVFTFSTGIRRVTREVRTAATGKPAGLEHLRDAWGGGTRIGASLAELIGALERRPARRDTIVLIASDGLDVGQPELLRTAMASIARRAAAVVWLNPLLETAGYQPTAGGMRIARPYVTTFASASDPAGLARLGRQVRLRAGG